jgi:hypothetical protein
MKLEFRWRGENLWIAETGGLEFTILGDQGYKDSFTLSIIDNESGKSLIRGRKKRFTLFQHAVQTADEWYDKNVLSVDEEE